jgi:acyl-CoA synthetase (AMP-forming)/AMP-acid ligase II
VQAYGMTEVSPVATLLSPHDHHDPVLRRSGGRAAPHSEVRIDGNDDTELPRGEVGEIVVRGGHVMAGYSGKPEETAAALQGGWMHTGDAGYLDENGYVFVVDRLKDMIVSGGENVLIGGYKIPRSFEVVDELPLSAAGKVLKRELRARYWTGSDRSVG